jgi:hypothetical protein
MALTKVTGEGVGTLSSSGATTATFNRTTSDGTVIDVQKSGSTVGSIGANGGQPYFINSSNKGIRPYTNGVAAAGSAGAFDDAAQDLGASSVRWRNLYLSGGVYLGGTGSSNHLDDYEEGTWTPTANTGLSYGFQQGRYIKVGNLVLASFDIDLDSVSASGNILSGLPFTTGNFGGNFGVVHIGYYSSITTGVVWLSGYTRTNLTSLYFTGNSSSQTTIQHNTFNVFNDTTRILGNLIYHSN